MQQRHKSEYKTIVKAPITKVWDALTNPQLVKEYFFGTNLVTDWKVGSPIYFKGEWEGKPYKDMGIVTDFVSNKTLTYTYLSEWSGLPDILENYLEITYQTKVVDEGTELTIIQTNYDEEKSKHSLASWDMIINSMKKLIE